MTTLDPFALAADLLDPPDPRTFERLGYTPHDGPQTEFHQLPAFAHGGPWDVLLGGAMGGGKTRALVMDAIDNAARYPGLEAWIVRDTYENLKRDVIAPQLEPIGFAKQQLGARWNGSEYTLRLPNASKVRFVYCRSTAEVGNVRGECQYLGLDERTLLDPLAVDHLKLRIRSGSHVPVIGIRSGTNPGGIGHSRIKSEFIDPAPLGRQLLPIMNEETKLPLELASGRVMERLFIPSTSSDNPSLDESYYARFGMMGADAIAAYRDGDWTRFEGMRFARFDPRRHVVGAGTIDVQLADRPRGLGIDWGGTAPFAAVWGAMLNEQLVIYREAHQAGLTPTEQAELILSLELVGERLPARPIPTWLDPATWARSPGKPLAKPISPDAPPAGSIAHGYRSAGVPVEKAYNDRISTLTLLDELLGDLDDGRPRMVISDACPNVIRSFSGAPRCPRNPEDVDGNYKDDHALDSLRYLTAGMMRGTMRRRPGRHQRTSGVRGATSGLMNAGT